MKCPNCSFMNPDQSVMCKICGYEFDKVPSKDGPHDSKHDASNDDDSEIEVTFDTLFGVRSNSRKIKNPLDKSKDKKRGFDTDEENHEPNDALDMPSELDAQEPDSQNMSSAPNSDDHEDSTEMHHTHTTASSILRPHSPVNEEVTPEANDAVTEEHPSDVLLDDDGNVIDIELIKTGDIQNDFYTSDDDILDEDHHKTDNHKVTIILLTVVILLIALVFAFTSSKLKFNPFASAPEPEAPVSEPVDNTPDNSNDPQTNQVINIDPNDTVKSFFEELPGYVNDNNISFSMYFKTPQSALEILTAFKNKGQIDKIEYDISETTLNADNSATVNVVSSIERTDENKHILSQDEWQFELLLEEDTWLIQDFSLNNQDSTVSNTNTNTDTSSSNSNSTPSTHNSTTTSTAPIKPKGFCEDWEF